jgi:hypothetical protein
VITRRPSISTSTVAWPSHVIATPLGLVPEFEARETGLLTEAIASSTSAFVIARSG